MWLLCRYSSGNMGEDSAAEDVDMIDAEPQVFVALSNAVSSFSLLQLLWRGAMPNRSA